MENLTSKVKKFAKNNWVLILILLIGIITRLAYKIIFHPPLTWSDSSLYDASAWNFVSGHGYSLDGIAPFVGREPGYALFFLAPIYFIFGHSILAAQVLQIILSLLIITFIYFIAKEYLGEKSALLASFIYALWPADIAFSQEILTEIPFTFLLIASMWLLLRGVKKDSSKIIFFAGLILGAATLTRFITVLLPFALFFVFYLIFKSYKKALKYFALILVGVFIFVGPWFLRNYLVFDKFVFGRAGAWQIYWSGSYIPWDGEWLSYKPPLTDLVKGKNIFEDDAILKKETIKNIEQNPLGVAIIWLKKPFKVFFRSVSYGQVANSGRFKKLIIDSALLEIVARRGLQLSHLFVMLFAVLGTGIILLKKHGHLKRLFMPIILSLFLYNVIFLLPMNPDPRYQIPLMPYFVMVAAFGIMEIYSLTRKQLN